MAITRRSSILGAKAAPAYKLGDLSLPDLICVAWFVLDAFTHFVIEGEFYSNGLAPVCSVLAEGKHTRRVETSTRNNTFRRLLPRHRPGRHGAKEQEPIRHDLVCFSGRYAVPFA